MADPARRRATYDDVLAAPEHVVAEIVDGELHTHPRPRARHAGATSALGIVLGAPFQFGDGGGPGGWIFLDEPELHLGGDVVVPDLAAWRRERMDKVPDASYLTLPPDWVCEALSASTERLDRGPKMDASARSGVAYAWLVDPRIQTLEAYRLERGHWVRLAVHAGNEPARVEPFEAVELRLERVWGL